MIKVNENIKNLLRLSGDSDPEKSKAGMRELTIALTTPLREGVLDGDILDGIFEAIDVGETNTTAEFPIDFIAPGTENEYVAYTMPNHGYIPQRNVEGDYVMVPTYRVGNAIDWNLKYARDARWDIVSRAINVYRAGFTKKKNDDGWHTLISAAVDRNIIVLDSDAGAGQFTKRLVSLMQTVMRRNGGGNSTSINRGALTDLYISPEAMQDIRNWNVDQVDETTRREIFVSQGEDALNRIFGVNLKAIDELGEGQEYQLFYNNTLSGTTPASDFEICVGLDLRNRDSFIMPVREEMQMFDDPALHRQSRAGVYGWEELGFAVLDSRRIILGSL